MVRHDYFLNDPNSEKAQPAAELAEIIKPISNLKEPVPETVNKIIGIYLDIEKANAKQECKLDTWY